MTRRGRHIVLVGLGVAAAVLLAAGWLVGTTPGSTWLLERALSLAPVKVTVERVEGRLADRFVLHGLRTAWQENALAIDELTLDWSPWSLPSRTLNISRLALRGLTLQLVPPAEPSTPATPRKLAWPSLPGWLEPWRIHVDALHLEDLRLARPSADDLHAERLSAALRLEEGRVFIDKFEGVGAGRRLHADLELGLKAAGLKGRLALVAADDSEMENLALGVDLTNAEGEGLVAGPVQATAGLPGWPDLRLDGRIKLTEERLDLTALKISRSDATGTVAGWLALGWTSPDLRGEGELEVQQWSHGTAPDEAVTVNGQLSGGGTIDAHHGRFDLRVTGNSWREGRLAGGWSGERSSLRAAIERGQWLGGELSGNLLAAWGERTEATIQLAARRLDPSRLAADWSGSVNLKADIGLTLDADDTKLRFDAAFADSRLRGVPLHGQTRGNWQGGTLQLDTLDLRGDGFSLQAQGVLAERLTLNLAVDDLGGLVPQSSGRLQGNGWFSYRAGDWRADVRANADRLRLGELSLDAASLSLHRQESTLPTRVQLTAGAAGYGIVQLMALQATLNGTPDSFDLDLATDMPDGSARTTLSARRVNDVWSGTLSDLQINQELAGDWRLVEPVTFRLDDRSVDLTKLQLRSPDGELSLAGRFMRHSKDHRFSFSARRLPLETLTPLIAPWGLTGALDAEVACEAQGCRLQADGLEALRHGDQVLYFENVLMEGSWNAGGLKTDLAFGLGEAGQLAASLTSRAPMNWQLPFDGQLTLFLRKLAPEALLSLVGGVPLSGSLSGELSTDWRNGRPDRIDLDLGGPLSWRASQEEEVALGLQLQGSWSDNGLMLTAQALPAVGGSMDVQATAASPPAWQLPQKIDLSAAWSDLPLLGLYHPPQQLQVAGAWSGNGEGTLYDNLSFRSSGSMQAVGGRLTWLDEDAGEISVRLRQATTDWQWQGESLQGYLVLGLEDRGQLEASWGLPLPARWPLAMLPQGAFQAQLAGRLEESGLLGLLVPDVVQETRGELSIDAALAGSWQEPALSGSARLQGGGAYLPAPGIHLKDLGVDARFDDKGIHFSGLSVTSGPGQLTGDGSIALKGWQPAGLDFAVRGEDFSLVHLPELQLRISPDLKLTGTPDAPTLSGDILIPYFLAAGRSERNPVPVSPDVIVLDAATREPRELPMKMTTRVRLLLGDQVLVKMFGLDARLGGELALTGSDLQNFSGQGEVHVEEGHYATYGVKLNIEKGRAVYAGGRLDNPAIDILALRKVGDVRAGVQIRGTAKVPDAKLFSEPAMPDTDVLSYVVLGRPLSQAGGETNPLMLAAGALLSAGDSAVLRSRLQSQLGIDTIEAGSDTGQPDDTVLRLGKYLTPDIYLSYGYSLFSQNSEVGLRYRFLENWEAESKFGVESGADLYYRFEFE